MEKIRKLLPIVLCVLLCGCSAPKKQAENRIVTGVRIQLKQEREILEWNYTDPQKMEVVLYYLRALKHKSPVKQDPERFRGRQYRIDLTYSDNTTRQIFQRSDRFLSEGFGPWQTIDPKKAAFLYPLLQSMPSDQ